MSGLGYRRRKERGGGGGEKKRESELRSGRVVVFGDTRTWLYLALFHCRYTSICVRNL